MPNLSCVLAARPFTVLCQFTILVKLSPIISFLSSTRELCFVGAGHTARTVSYISETLCIPGTVIVNCKFMAKTQHLTLFMLDNYEAAWHI